MKQPNKWKKLRIIPPILQVKMERKWIFLGTGALIVIAIFFLIFPFNQSASVPGQTTEIETITTPEVISEKELTFCEAKTIEINSIKRASLCKQDSDCILTTVLSSCDDICVDSATAAQLGTLVSEYNQNSCNELICGSRNANEPDIECVCFTETCTESPIL